MIIQSIKLTDFGPFLGSHLVTFQPGYNVIVGDNGVGKSRLSQGILWTMFGARALSGITEDQLSPIGFPDRTPAAELVLIDYKKKIIISRTALSAEVKVNDKTVARGKAAVTNFLDSSLGVTPSVMNAVCYVAQDELGAIIHLDAEKRIKAWESIFDIQTIQEAIRLLDRDLLELSQALSCTGLLEDYANITARIAVLETELGDSAKQIVVLERTIKELNLQIFRFNEKQNALQGKIDQYNENLTAAQKIQNERIPLLDKEIELLNRSSQDLGKMMNSVSSTLNELRQELTTISPTAFKMSFEDVQNAATLVQQLTQKTRQTVLQIEQANAMIPVIRKPKYNRPDSELIEDLCAESDRRRQDRDAACLDLKTQTRHFEASSKNDICSHCGSVLTEKHRERIAQELEILKQRVSKLSSEYEITNAAAEQGKIQLQEWADYTECSERAEVLRSSIRALTTKQTEFETQLLEARKQEAELKQRWNEYNSTTVRRSTIEANIEQHCQSLTRAKQNLNDVSAKLRKASVQRETLVTLCQSKRDSVPVKEYQKLKNQIESIETQCSPLRTQLQKAEAERGVLVESGGTRTTTLQNLKKIKAEQDEKVESFRKSQEVAHRMAEAKHSLSAFRKAYSLMLLSRLSDIVNRFYQTLSTSDYEQIKFHSDFRLVGLRRGREHTVHHFSYAQKMSAALALRLAIRQVSQDIFKNGFGFFILDEPTASFSAARVLAFKDMIGSILGLIPQIIISTHHRDLMFGNVVQLRQVDGVSSICPDSNKSA